MFLVMCASFALGIGLEIYALKGVKKRKKIISYSLIVLGVCALAFAIYLAFPK